MSLGDERTWRGRELLAVVLALALVTALVVVALVDRRTRTDERRAPAARTHLLGSVGPGPSGAQPVGSTSARSAGSMSRTTSSRDASARPGSSST